jgi:four helix bundle protein
MFQALPKTEEARVLGRQVLRSGTSQAANYRSACRARSRADFISKIGIALEEADETAFWLEMLADAGIAKQKRVESLVAEANELVRIFQASPTTPRVHAQSPIINRKSPIANRPV